MQKKELPVVIPSKSMIVGDQKAPVQITIFGDYESTETRQLHNLIKKALKTFAGKVNFVFRHFPLTTKHQKAHKAAEAAIAAGQEGKFWEMHQQLIDHPHQLGVISLKAHAREAGVMNKRFLEQLINGDFGWYVQDDIKDGLALGIRDIPVLLINGEKVDKPYTTNHINKIIRSYLNGGRYLPLQGERVAA